MRLIDADKIEWIIAKVAFVNEETGEEANTEKKEVAATFKDWVDEIPTADAAPVVHAKWKATVLKRFFGNTAEDLTCSRCNQEVTKQLFAERPNYCPYCGAKMDRED